jgi:hypothetical protein
MIYSRSYKRVASRWLKEGGLIEPPPKMVEEIKEWVIAQVASHKIPELQAKMKSAVEDAQKWLGDSLEKEKEIRQSIKTLKDLLQTGRPRELFQAYKEFYTRSAYFMGLWNPEKKMSAFSSKVLKDPNLKKDMVDEILAIIKETEDRVKDRVKSRKSDPGKVTKEYQQRIRSLQKLLIPGIKPMKGDSATKKFPVNLEGWYSGQVIIEAIRKEQKGKIKGWEKSWKERGRSDSEAEEMIKEMLEQAAKKWATITTTLTLDLGMSKAVAVWIPARQEIRIKVPENADFSASLTKSVKHELRHMGQYILADMVTGDDLFHSKIDAITKRRRPGPGLPSRHIMTPQYSQHKELPRAQRGKGDSHHLDDIEFYTDLADAIDSMKSTIKRHEKDGHTQEELKAAFRRMIYDMSVTKGKHWIDRKTGLHGIAYKTHINEFFRSLKNYAKPKWQKAVAEAYKKIFSGPMRQRVTARWLNRTGPPR